MPMISAPESSLSVSDSHCNGVTAVVRPQFYTWDTSSSVGFIPREVLSQFLKLWALFRTAVWICSCHCNSWFHSCKTRAPEHNCTLTHQAGSTATGTEPSKAGTWAWILIQSPSEVCSTGITLFPQRHKNRRTNLVYFWAGSKLPMKRQVRAVWPAAWHPSIATKRETKKDPQGPRRLKETMRYLLWSLIIVWYSIFLNEQTAGETWNGTFSHLLVPSWGLSGNSHLPADSHKQKEHWEINLE